MKRQGRAVAGLGDLWSELRIRQWVKNVFVLAPLLFARALFDFAALGRAVSAFGAFCLVSSAVYVFNDLVDREEDRLHPKKRLRPIASGALPVSVATGLCVALLAAGASIAWGIGGGVAWTLAAYLGVNAAYTLWIKRQVILDVFAIASGFVLRVVAGGLAIRAEISYWLLLCTTLLALFLGFSKRRHELVLLGDEASTHRFVLAHYSTLFLDMMMAIVTACTLMAYALYTVSGETVVKFGTHALFYTFPFVLYGIFRYLYLVYRPEEAGDPTQNLFSDPPTVINLVLWAVTSILIVYGNR